MSENDSTMTELERRVARAMYADTNDCPESQFDDAEQVTQDCYLSNARVARKAHAESLGSKITNMDQDNAASSVTVYFDEPEHSIEFFEALSAAQQEDQHHD